MLNQYPSVLLRPAGNRTSVMQIMYRMRAATSRRCIDAIETPYNAPKSRRWAAERNSALRAISNVAPSAKCSCYSFDNISTATMVRMSARYGHFGLEDLRSAVETISTPAEAKIGQRSPVNPPGLSGTPDAKVH
jgi:hypothetical protein